MQRNDTERSVRLTESSADCTSDSRKPRRSSSLVAEDATSADSDAGVDDEDAALSADALTEGAGFPGARTSAAAASRSAASYALRRASMRVRCSSDMVTLARLRAAALRCLYKANEQRRWRTQDDVTHRLVALNVPNNRKTTEIHI